MHGRNPPTFTPMDTIQTPRTDRSTPITEEDFSDLVEECNSPAAKRIEQLERELAETKKNAGKIIASQASENILLTNQRDRLAEKAQAVAHALFQHGTIGSWCDEAKDLREALAAVKGTHP